MARASRSSEKEAFWRAKLSDHQNSGLSVREFCNRQQLSEASFYSWRREIERRDKEVSDIGADPRMVPVAVIDRRDASEIDNGHSCCVEFVTPDGYLFRFQPDVSADRLAKLLQAIETQRKGVRSC